MTVVVGFKMFAMNKLNVLHVGKIKNTGTKQQQIQDERLPFITYLY